jgi:F-type H+-transporting ATPase subunit alpha
MVELLKQGQYKPMNVADQVLIIFAGTRGYLDDVPRPKVAEWETDFLTFMRDQHSEIRNKIVETKDLDDATMAELVKAIGEFRAQFAAKQAQPAKT